ncbi:MAG: thiamine phosphate synthase, partial [Acidobacteriota bacterium]
GVRLIQLRAKTTASGPLLDLADSLAERCRSAGAIFVVNDRVDIARLARASGVHLGQTDLAPADARRLVAPEMIVGVSTHNADQIQAAIDEPVDYIAVGPVFATATKANPDPVIGLDGVRQAAFACSARHLPVVAIGGVTLERAAAVIAAGASTVAVISDLLSGDPASRARAFMSALS